MFNAAGRPVRAVSSDVRPPGVYAIARDGRNSNGDALSSGVYFLKAEAGGRAVTREVSQVR